MTAAQDRLQTRLATLKEAGRHRAPARPGLGEIALHLAEEDPQRIVISDARRDVTRAQMVDMARRLGGALLDRGIAPGAVIAFQLPNWWEACVINMTAALFGYRILPLLPIYRAAELGVILPECGVRAVFVPPADKRVDYRALISGIDGAPEHVFTVRGDGSDGPAFDPLLAHDPAAPRLPAPEDAKMIIFTSGSTGRPKGVIHTHASLDAVVRDTAAFWDLDSSDVMYVPSPISHIGGSIYAFEFPWISGCRTILEDHWDPDRAVARIDAEGVTFMAGATPFLKGLLAASAQAGTRLTGLRRFICGGASVPPDLVQQALERFPNAVVSRAYGSTEVPLACPGIRDRASAMARTDTDGEVEVEVRLLEETGGEGEIAFRGPNMFIGYLDPEHDAGNFTPDGFFLMGDMGRVIDDRFITITGRKKDIIIRKGENISPLEIENALMSHPDVAAVALVGAPEPERGEMVVAFLVPAPGATFGMAEMTAHLSGCGFARQKFPERLEIVEALPMNTVGKVQKPELRQIAARLVAQDMGPNTS
ncbi:AMP-binding protein [Pseudooceanicola sp.]|uniref:AMP-binding protein n=1 Tax=Pseudooceanicola sp. TaxID=1914328 RepID=UPI0035C6D5DB